MREIIDVKVKKLVPEAVIPFYAKPGDAGMDITCIGYHYDKDNDCYMYHTGLAFELPSDCVMLIFPRSSNRKTDYYLCNHVGILDSGYRGELMFAYKNRTDDRLNYQKPPYEVGDRIGQIIILPYPTVEMIEVDSLEESERGTGGFGSTGK